ncbi:hypothetical protein L2E82_44498 [Cichorium intybus]|uniref:Uncharacterized protein n=1 Tax=Cichorium intybus TaxID=13427 RepID=A0ACB8ZQA5_CICIN|nr:hypothetical protein L2E82_44498 [Cichorium intybus]
MHRRIPAVGSATQPIARSVEQNKKGEQSYRYSEIHYCNIVAPAIDCCYIVVAVDAEVYDLDSTVGSGCSTSNPRPHHRMPDLQLVPGTTVVAVVVVVVAKWVVEVYEGEMVVVVVVGELTLAVVDTRYHHGSVLPMLT